MNTREEGSRKEEEAAAYLEAAGFEILEKNFRSRQGELDIVAREGRYLVFVEVKYRHSGRSGDPAEAVNARKQQRMISTARYYLKTRGLPADTPCRFDVVGIEGDAVRLLQNAFAYIPRGR